MKPGESPVEEIDSFEEEYVEKEGVLKPVKHSRRESDREPFYEAKDETKAPHYNILALFLCFWLLFRLGLHRSILGFQIDFFTTGF